MSLAEVAAGCGLALWLVLTVVRQLPGRVGRALRDRDPLGVLPGWTFFAPHPGRHDWILLMRNRLPGDEIGPWQEVRWRQPRSPRWMFNPSRRMKKATFDMVAVLQLQGAELGEERRLVLSVPYLAWLGATQSRVSEDSAVTQTQFTVLGFEGRGDQDPHPFLVSDFHDR